jgi:hypothetical protein
LEERITQKGLKLLLSQRKTSKLGLTELGRKNNTKRAETSIKPKKTFKFRIYRTGKKE